MALPAVFQEDSGKLRLKSEESPVGLVRFEPAILRHGSEIGRFEDKPALQESDPDQNFAHRGTRGKVRMSRMLAMPVMYITERSNPKPNPACGTVPQRRMSVYQ